MKLTNNEEFFCPMLKANAYGHGDVQLAQVCQKTGVSHVGVALYEEAINLRAANIQCHILVFYPFINDDLLQLIVQLNITPVISSWEGLAKLAEQKLPINVHVKFNTGMARLGFNQTDARDIKNFFEENTQLKLKGICTHLSQAEDYAVSSGATVRQFQLFKEICDVLAAPEIVIHALNSEATIARYCFSDGEKKEIGCRPGIALFGVKPFISNLEGKSLRRWEDLNLKPVMELKSEIVELQFLNKGEKVSYGGQYVVERESCIAIVSIGYADGYFRNFSNRAKVLCCGQEFHVAGTVCMDYIMIDITDAYKKQNDWVGQTVTLLGSQEDKHISAEYLASLVKTNSYEIFTNVSNRVPRVYE